MESAHEYTTTLYGCTVTVNKDGGGTVGRAYDGNWTVSVRNGPVFVLDNDTMRTGTPKTHVQVARMAYEFAANSMDAGL